MPIRPVEAHRPAAAALLGAEAQRRRPLGVVAMAKRCIVRAPTYRSDNAGPRWGVKYLFN
jgi:hypothetical protein